MTEWQIKNKKIFFHARIIHSINLPQITHLNTDDFLWGHGDKYSSHGCYFWTRINRIERIVPCGRHFHPSASNCCYCNRKSVKICAICGSINLKRYFLKNIIPTDEIVHTDELSSHRLHTQIIFHAEEHGLFRTRINRIERIFHPDHITSKLHQMNTDYFPCGGTRIILNTNKPNRTNSPSGSHFV